MIGWRVDLLGDSALAVRVQAGSSIAANACVHRLARAIRAAGVRGVRDLVPGMRDLVVHVDPLRCDVAAVVAAVEQWASAAEAGVEEPATAVADRAARQDGDVVTVPVTYGGTAGPDLDGVAAACGLSTEEVCRRHAAADYVVCFVGFLPGFPYLGPLDAALRLPRRRAPRPRVPAGSVALAGEYTGIYPWESPGGWHLIGRTAVALFDVGAESPALLQPGMRVRFVPEPPRG